MTLRDILNFVYTFTLQTSGNGTLGNPHLSRNGDVELQDYAHHAHMALFTMIAAQGDRYFHKTGLINEQAGQKTYDLPLDLERLIRLERVAGGGNAGSLPYTIPALGGGHHEIEAYRVARPASSTDPLAEAYYQHGQKQIEFVNASISSVTGAFKPYYIFRPARMTADTHVPFMSPAAAAPATAYDNLDEWHDIIALRTLEMALLKSGDVAASAIGMKAASRESDLRRFLGSAHKQRPRMVTYTRFGE